MTTREIVHILTHSPVYFSRPLRERSEMVKDYRKAINDERRKLYVDDYFALNMRKAA